MKKIGRFGSKPVLRSTGVVPGPELIHCGASHPYELVIRKQTEEFFFDMFYFIIDSLNSTELLNSPPHCTRIMSHHLFHHPIVMLLFYYFSKDYPSCCF